MIVRKDHFRVQRRVDPTGQQRDSDGEFGMLRFVAHCVHTQQTAHASAQHRNGHQGH